ncbi:uncharacterized protein [Epargyreus clarus]
MGLIRGVPVEWSPEDIKESITVPFGCGEIIRIRRLNYKVMVDGSPVWKPSQTVVLTFDGQILPKHIYICYNALAVELYTYPTIQCYQCCRYGHTKTQCRSKPRCFKCGEGHTGDSCDIEDDCALCCSCTGAHFATDKSCPEFVRQKQIKLTMAQSCISYAEASKLHPPIPKSYSDALKTPQQQYVIQDSNKLSHANHSTVQQNRSSYKKTVFLKPRSPPKQQKGYDQVTHQSMIREYDIPLPSNGSLINTNVDVNKQTNVNEIIVSLINLLLQNNICSPNNAAALVEIMKQITIDNGSQIQNPAVELQKHNKQEN